MIVVRLEIYEVTVQIQLSTTQSMVLISSTVAYKADREPSQGITHTFPSAISHLLLSTLKRAVELSTQKYLLVFPRYCTRCWIIKN